MLSRFPDECPKKSYRVSEVPSHRKNPPANSFIEKSGPKFELIFDDAKHPRSRDQLRPGILDHFDLSGIEIFAAVMVQGKEIVVDTRAALYGSVARYFVCSFPS